MAGILYLLQIPLGVFGIIYVPAALVAPGEVTITASNILSHEFLFRLSMVSAILCTLLTIATAAVLYRLFDWIDKRFATMMVLCTVVYTPIAMLNELNHVAILLLLKNPAYLAAYSQEQIHGLIPLFLELHKYGEQIVGIFFGLWLLPMGLLVIKSKFIPKGIGVLLIIASCGYLADFLLYFLSPGVNFVFSNYTFFGEVVMVIWLLVKGVNMEQWNSQLHLRNPTKSFQGSS